MKLEPFELEMLKKIVSAYYMKPILENLQARIKEIGVQATFDYLHDILRQSQGAVEALLEIRKAKNIIKDISQARKSIAGAAFSNCVIYTFLKAKEAGLVDSNIYVTNKTTDSRFESIVTIYVGDETQKPDMDLIFYSLLPNQEISQMMIVSLKTSLRERAGQTYKWKLLMEIASTENSIRDKYDIRYEPKHIPIVCFATVNFYDEINQPQHRGMFKFFDASFIGKPIESSFISNLSSLIDFVNGHLSTR